MEYLYATFDEISASIGTANDIKQVDCKKNETFSLKGMDYLHLKDAFIHPFVGGIFFKAYWIYDHICYSPSGWNNAAWMTNANVTFDSDLKKLKLSNDCSKIEFEVKKGNYFYIDSVVHDNFGHFVHDVMPSCILFDSIVESRPGLTPVLQHKFKYKNQKDIFSKLFVDYESSYFIKKSVIFENLFIPRRQQNFHSGYFSDDFKSTLEFNATGINYAKVKLSSLLHNHYQSKIKIRKIYFYRKLSNKSIKDQHNRSFLNIDKLNEILLERGFLCVDPAELSVTEIHVLLSHAETIISIHGAGLANMIFAKEGVTVIEIRPSTGVWRSLEYVAKSLFYNFYYSNAISDSLGNQIIDLNSIVKIIDSHSGIGSA